MKSEKQKLEIINVKKNNPNKKKLNKSSKLSRKNKIVKDDLIEYAGAMDLIDISKKYNKMNENTIKKLTESLDMFLLGTTLKGEGDKNSLLLLAYPMREDLIKEYNITTRSEFMILDTVIINYLKYICYNQYLASYTNADRGVGTSDIKNIEKLQKAADASFNNYLNSMSVLRQLKLNPMNINIKNSQVNIGKNQQIINKDSNPELNESK